MVSLKSSQKDTRIRDRQPDWITGRQINEGLRELGAGFRQDALTKIPYKNDFGGIQNKMPIYIYAYAIDRLIINNNCRFLDPKMYNY